MVMRQRRRKLKQKACRGAGAVVEAGATQQDGRIIRMKDEFTNRLGMFDTALVTLNKPEHKAIWENQPPLVFTTKVADAGVAVTDLRAFCRKQETDITGAAADKAREEQEAIDATHAVARALVTWFRDQNDETNAAKVDLSPRAWGRLRDQQFLEKGRLVKQLADGVLAGANAAQAVTYGITAAAVAAVQKEVEEYGAVISAPQASIADRKATTAQLRAKFNAVEAKFGVLDDLILQYGATPAGRAMVLAYQAARTVRDLGTGPQPPAPPPT
jgi:hypothetical protein